MSLDARVLRCAYEESALWELAAEVGGGDAATAVRDLVARGLLFLYVESGWPRLVRRPIAPADVSEALARAENWAAPSLEGSDVRALHARTIGIALTDEGLRALYAARDSG